jgi:hypothetical protein
MTPFRLVLVIVAGCCLVWPAPLLADDVVPPAPPVTPTPAATSEAPPFAMEKHYSADLAILMKNGAAIQSKTYVDGDKMRSNVSMNGMDMAIIVRKDEKKIYQVMESQKMVMVSDFNPDKYPGGSAASFGPEGKFTLIGPDTVDGVLCTKYLVTPDKTKQVFFFWLDTAQKVPVEMAAADGSLVVKWKNFVAGPQDASLFEVPAGYQTMDMQGMPGASP